MGKNDGTVQNITYFTCKPKHGIFVRGDKLIHDKRGKAMRAYKAEKLAKGKGFLSSLKTISASEKNIQFFILFSAERESSLTRSKSRGDSLNAVGTARK